MCATDAILVATGCNLEGSYRQPASLKVAPLNLYFTELADVLAILCVLERTEVQGCPQDLRGWVRYPHLPVSMRTPYKALSRTVLVLLKTHSDAKITVGLQ